MTGDSTAGLGVGRPVGLPGAGLYAAGTILLLGVAVVAELCWPSGCAGRARRCGLLHMSGYAAEVVADHGVLGTGTALIDKPFTADMLLRKVRGALDG